MEWLELAESLDEGLLEVKRQRMEAADLRVRERKDYCGSVGDVLSLEALNVASWQAAEEKSAKKKAKSEGNRGAGSGGDKADQAMKGDTRGLGKDRK